VRSVYLAQVDIDDAVEPVTTMWSGRLLAFACGCALSSVYGFLAGT